jgi:hypothetical protein
MPTTTTTTTTTTTKHSLEPVELRSRLKKLVHDTKSYKMTREFEKKNLVVLSSFII